MRNAGIFRRNGQRGFYLIGLMIVAVIIMILTYQQVGPGGLDLAGRTGQTHIQRAELVVCKTDRNVLKTQIQMWQINHQGEKMTMEKVQGYLRCSQGGKWTFNKDATYVFCSKCEPDPNMPPPPTPTPISGTSPF